MPAPCIVLCGDTNGFMPAGGSCEQVVVDHFRDLVRSFTVTMTMAWRFNSGGITAHAGVGDSREQSMGLGTYTGNADLCSIVPSLAWM
jgi:hypothetical protein